MWALWLLTVPSLALAASFVSCPGDAFCDINLEETSFEFLHKLTVKQIQNVVNLKMTNASIEKINPKLKYLKNLKHLDLSFNNIQIHSIPPLPNLRVLKLRGNNLKQIHFKQLPKNLEELDLSDNLLAQIPEDWKYLKNLKRLYINKNQMNCECFNVLKFKDLLQNNIVVSDGVLCHSPKSYKGKDIQTVNCSIEDIMLNDEGSGNGDVAESDAPNLTGISHLHETEDDATEINTFINDQDYLLPSVRAEEPSEDEKEGSGDEGSGCFPIILPDVVFHVNCSTPGPLESDSNASPLPHPIDQARIILEDLNILETRPTPTTTTTKSPPTNIAPVPATEVFVEVIDNHTLKGELERASLAPTAENSPTVYVIVGVCVLLAVIFVALFVKKRRSRAGTKQNRLEAPDAYGEEMKPMNKPVVETVNEKTSPAESAPLINGNGKAHDDIPVLKTFAPDHENVNEEVPEIRKRAAPELLTPRRERVTIRASEIPDSLPKTPVLVHRQKNSDGNIVTTPVVSS